MRALIVSLLTLISMQTGYAQAPSNLMTDLLEHTDRVFLDGYLTTMPLSAIETAIERYQITHIRNDRPYFGWVMKSDLPNTVQMAYCVEVASSQGKLEKGEADVWNSGKVVGDNSVAVRYDGTSLQPSRVYYWRVKTWDNYGNESPFSAVKSFMTATELDGGTATYPLQITDEHPKTVAKVGEGNTFADFGRASFARLKLTLVSETGMDTVTIRLGEHSVNGRVDRKPGASIRYTEYKLPLMAGIHTYTVKFRPDGRNTSRNANESGVSPIFMPGYIGEVYPFRYCEVDGYDRPLTDKDIVRQSVHYPFNDMAADFSSSDTVLNQVWDISKYSIKATSFMGTYVDGDRERIAYEADALVNQLCHYFVDREFSMARHSHEYLLHNPTWPTEWNMQSVIMAWNDYLHTGNKASLERYYADLKAKTLMALKEDNGLISTRTGKLTKEFNETIHFRGKAIRDIVDWPQAGVFGPIEDNPGEADGYELTTYNTVVNAYHYEALRLAGLMAGILDNKADENFYAAEAERVKTQVDRLLFDREKGVYKDGAETGHVSLHANMFPMAFGMVSDKNAGSVSEFIKSRGMACSVYASQFLMDAAYDMHEARYGLELLSSTSQRSWYNMIREGSTVTLEAWGRKYKPNLDWNHAWGAVPANIIPRKLMGVEPITPGFGRMRIKPQPASLRNASVKVPTIRGDVEMSFVNDPGERFLLDVEIPANSTAEVWLPLESGKYILHVDGKQQKGIVSGGFVKTEIGSGKHTFIIEARK